MLATSPNSFPRRQSYADRILKGTKPSELPVQAPIKFDLVINLKTAKALGLDVPLQLQQRADDVIDIAMLLLRCIESGIGTKRRKPRR